MYLVHDLNEIGPAINDINRVAVAAICDSSFATSSPNIYNAAVLVPPVDILMTWADGAPYIMENQYPMYLNNNQDADDMIVALLAAMTTKDIFLYIPRDEFDIFGMVLLNHIYMNYGITVNIPGVSAFYFDASRTPLILSKFFMMDVMDAQDYLASFPNNLRLPDFVINKLVMTLQPPELANATFEQCAEYFNNMIGKSVATPMFRMVKDL